MPSYLYRILVPNLNKEDCPQIEIEHSYKETLTHDPQSGYPLERIYTAPHLSKGYSSGHTKKILSNENIAKAGFTKYVRDRSSGTYVKTAGKDGPTTFSVR